MATIFQESRCGLKYIPQRPASQMSSSGYSFRFRKAGSNSTYSGKMRAKRNLLLSAKNIVHLPSLS